jgi:hypothetical protein
MPEEFNITGWLDPLFKYFAEQSKLPVEDISANQGGEAIGVAMEVVSNIFTKGFLNKGIQFLAGLIADGYAIFGKDVSPRLRKELLAMGTHELLRIATMTPSEIKEFQESLKSFMEAVQKGDWNSALASVLRTPSEVKAMLGMGEVETMPSPVATLPPAPAESPPAESPPAGQPEQSSEEPWLF